MILRAAILAAVTAASVTTLSAQNSARAARKTAAIAGRIIQTDGAAAEGARVAVYALVDGAAGAVVGRATSSYDGRYEVTGLPAGRFLVGVTPQRIRGFGGDSRRLTTVPVETLYPGVTDRSKAQPVDVYDGVSTEGIDIWVAPGAERYSISGRVSWPENVTVDNVVIEYGGPGDARHGVWYVSDPGGLFTIEGASQGTYLLMVRAQTANGPLLGLAATNVSNDSVQDVRLTLGAPGTVEGRVITDGPAGPDLSRSRITPVHALLKRSPLYPVEEAVVDAAGRFTLAQLLGEYTLTVKGLPPGWRVRRIVRAGTPLPENRLIVHSGERVTAIDVVIAAGS